VDRFTRLKVPDEVALVAGGSTIVSVLEEFFLILGRVFGAVATGALERAAGTRAMYFPAGTGPDKMVDPSEDRTPVHPFLIFFLIWSTLIGCSLFRYNSFFPSSEYTTTGGMDDWVDDGTELERAELAK
jgi:hypothetical protein